MNCRCKDKEEEGNYITIKFRYCDRMYELSTDSFNTAEDITEFINHALRIIGYDFLECTRKE